MEFPILDSLGSLVTLITYIITVIIGGVGYKFLSLWFKREQDKEDNKSGANQQAINALRDQVTAFANMFESQNSRIYELEKDIRKYQEELLRVTTEQVRAEMHVKLLERKVSSLEEQVEYYKSLEEKNL